MLVYKCKQVYDTNVKARDCDIDLYPLIQCNDGVKIYKVYNKSSFKDNLDNNNWENLQKFTENCPNIVDEKEYLSKFTKFEILHYLSKQNVPVKQFKVVKKYDDIYKDLQLIIPVNSVTMTNVIDTIDKLTKIYSTVLVMHPFIMDLFNFTSYIITLNGIKLSDEKPVITNGIDLVSFQEYIYSRHYILHNSMPNNIFNDYLNSYVEDILKLE